MVWSSLEMSFDWEVSVPLASEKEEANAREEGN
jgi:hypothetical protein